MTTPQNTTSSLEEMVLMQLPEEVRTRISTEVSSTVDAFEAQFMAQVSIFARESEAHMSASDPSTQGSDFRDFFTVSDLQNAAFNMHDMFSPTPSSAYRMQDQSSSMPPDQIDFDFLPTVWNSTTGAYVSNTHTPMTPSPSNLSGPSSSNTLSPRVNQDEDVMSLIQKLRKDFQALEKKIGGSSSLT